MHRIPIESPEGVRWMPDEHSGAGVLVLAGSSGRIDDDRARLFARAGCIAESIRWFGGPGQHDGPWEIPLETFFDRIDRLTTACDRVFVGGTSFGSEAALLCGALSSQVSGVTAFAPSDVIWAGIRSDGTQTSHGTLNQAALPHLPFDFAAFRPEEPPRFLPLYTNSRRTFTADVDAATIPTERIAKLVLVAGGDDQVWPSVAHAQRIAQRRTQYGLSTTLVTDEAAGHRAILPGEDVVSGGRTMHRGGTESADRALGERAWAAIMTMLSHP